VSAPPAEFDRFARDYARLHAASIAAAGEEPAYYAEYKLRRIQRLVGERFAEPVLDYGCGVGTLLALLAGRFPHVEGFDPSGESLALARARAPGCRLHDDAEALPPGTFGLVVLACVLHHVPPAARPAVLARVRRLLRPGGRVIVFEHNPMNPLTRRAVALCPFDQGVELLWPRETRRRLRGAGFEGVRCEHIVFFPRPLARLRVLEPSLRRVPLGAQYEVVGVASGPARPRSRNP
jgi:SAM-dependent methyltransferase